LQLNFPVNPDIFQTAHTMNPQTTHYLVGIDLGTTHTVVAYCDAHGAQQTVQIFEVMQLVAPGEVLARPLLPSVRYHPAESELSEADTRFSAGGETTVIGEAARVLGAKTQGRLVTSAKSWLSHPSVDHTADILPWGGAEGVVKVSPLHASASYLAHVRTVWNQQFRDAPLEQQDIVITVPASFDEAARALTLEAARIAGLHNIRLLEEPQAVCYDWLRRHQDNLKEALSDVHLLLVCDVGGGTTDLTLIKVEPGEPEPKLTRIGVGDHLMLGGDNVDLALAHLAEKRLAGGERKLSPADLSQLLEQCRNAKERLLGADAPDTYKVTLLGGGSKLIGGARSATLTKDEVRAIALDGFFPLSELDELPDRKRSGVVEFGLPYAAEPAVSKHIAAFLKLHRQAAQQAVGDERGVPDALLLNGGVFRSAAITRRTIDLLSAWRGRPIKLLKNAHPELAVAYGAVSFALARRGKKLKIGGGSARSYFLLVDTEQTDVKHGVCILPRGSEEGDEILLKERQFALRLGQPVRFHLASLTGDSAHHAGDLTVIGEQFNTLPPLAVAFEQGGGTQKEVIVQLAATLTEIGTLQIQCVAVDDNAQRWDVEFQIRKSRSVPSDGAELPSRFDDATEAIALVFGKKTRDIAPQAVKTLRGDLEKLLGPREEWRTPLLRALFTELLDGMKNRRRSEAHERAWLSMAGFCLRPGFGYPLDDWRVEQLWQSYAQGIQFVNETPNWAEWWTLWRRVAGGLDTAAQERLFADLTKYLNPASVRQGNLAKQAKQRSYDDMVRCAAVLERLPGEKKLQLGGWLLQRLQKPSESNQTWWAVGRIGARMPFHGSAHYVLAANAVSPWLEQMLAVDWKKTPQAGFAAALLTRMSGDRVRDIDDALRLRIVDKLKASKAPVSWLQLVEAVKELDEKEESQIFGEALPPGLKLL
jgi:molecular chaperone DnaK (HSP70)